MTKLVKADPETTLTRLRRMLDVEPYIVTPQVGMVYGAEAKYVTWKFEPRAFETIELLHITDVQFGHVECRVHRVKEYIAWVLSKPNRFVLFGGDLIDAAHAMSPGQPWENICEPQGQVYRFCELFAPLRPRILGYVGGNHERRGLKTFGDLGLLIASLLQIPYSAGKQFIDVYFGKHRPFKVSLWHGTGAARTAGAKMQMLDRFMQEGDSQVYLVGHLHDAMSKFKWRIERKAGHNDVHMQKVGGAMSSSFLSHFGCVDAQTECLTTEGWKSHVTMRGDETVATLSLQGGVDWLPCRGKFVYDYCGEMARVRSRSLDMLMTPNHRTVIWNAYLERLEVRRADELCSHNEIPVAAKENRFPVAYSPPPALASVLGWFLAEGHYRKDGSAGIAQSVAKHPRYVRAIRLALSKAGLRFSEHRHGGMLNFYLPRPSADVLRAIVPDKLLCAWLVAMPLRQTRKLFDALMRGDGCFSGKRTWKQKSAANRDWFQILAFRLGISSNNRSLHESVALSANSLRRFRAGDGGIETPLLWVPHVGKVWCIHTDNTTFIARRGGKIFATGNTYAEVAGLSPSDILMARIILEPDGRWGISLK